MKIQITTQKPDEVQRFFSAPLSFSQKVTVKKLLIVEQILERMKALDLNRSKLAAQMEISPARVTTMMMDGTNNFIIETLMRAADALDRELALTIVPKGHQITEPSPSSASSGFTKPSTRQTARLSSASPPPPSSTAPAVRCSPTSPRVRSTASSRSPRSHSASRRRRLKSTCGAESSPSRPNMPLNLSTSHRPRLRR